MKKSLAQFLRLPAGEKAFAFNALLLGIFLRVCIKLGGFNNTIKLLSLFERQTPTATKLFDAGRYSKSIAFSYGFAPYINCLAISTAHWWLMKKRGIPVQMKFGMKKQNEKLAAHSWLEYNGITFSKDMAMNKKYTAFEAAIL
jgi:hypothetical protein